MPTVAYLRCSTDEQDTLRQREAIQRSGLKIDQWLEDHESRDKADKRRDFQRLLRAVQSGQVDTIVVQALDRFGVRDAWELGKFFSILKDHECRLLDSTGKQLNGDDDGSVICSTVGALTSSREQREKASRVLTGKLTLARKGQFLGGYCPYGMDVVAFDAEGKEVWRVVHEGHDRRVKVYPDGRRERFDGKRNRPPKALHETLKYRPSIVAERVKYVKLIFRWYSTESISPGQIAARLNDLGVSPVFSPLWHQNIIKYLLANPVYVGKPAYNKTGNGRFMEFTGGQVKTAERKPSRKHGQSDQIRPDGDEFEPMTAPAVFEQAQAKTAATKKRVCQAPKTASLWLRGFVVCAKCGGKMGGLSGNPGNGFHPGYVCPEYRRWGKRAPSGCSHFRIDHEILEGIVLDYLTQTAPEIKALLDATTADNLDAARPLLEAITEGRGRRDGLGLEMLAFVDTHFQGSKARRHAETMSLEAVYSRVYEKTRPTLEKALQEKEAELDGQLDAYRDLPTRLKERAVQRMKALQDEIDALRGDLKNLRIPWDRLRADLVARKEALERTTATLNQEGHFRQKTEALKCVVGKILCHFKGTRLDSVEMVPAEDAAVRPLTFPAPLLEDSRISAFA